MICWPFLFWNGWGKHMRTVSTSLLGMGRLLSCSEHLQAPLKGPPLRPDGNCGLTVPGEGAALGFGEPPVRQAARALLTVTEETLLQLEGQTGQKMVRHLLLAWRPVSSALSSCCISTGDRKQAPCRCKRRPSWPLGGAAASGQSLQVQRGVFMLGEPGSQERWDPGANAFIIPRCKLICNSKWKHPLSTWKLWTWRFFLTPFFVWNTYNLL